MPQSVQQILAQSTFYTDGTDYTLIKLPARAIIVAAGIIAEVGEPFGALIVDKNEVTLLTYSEVVDEFKSRLIDVEIQPIPYRLITIDIELPSTLIGFIAYISQSLADAGISILPYAAFTRDHIVVPADKVEKALSVLETLRSGK
jgi:hypothetical protein